MKMADGLLNICYCGSHPPALLSQDALKHECIGEATTMHNTWMAVNIDPKGLLILEQKVHQEISIGSDPPGTWEF